MKRRCYHTDDVKVFVELFNDRPISELVTKCVTCTIVEIQVPMKGVGATPQSPISSYAKALMGANFAELLNAQVVYKRMLQYCLLLQYIHLDISNKQMTIKGFRIIGHVT